MLTEYRTWLTVKAQAAHPIGEWEDLLAQLATSPSSRGPVMKCGAPYTEAGFTVSYPATDTEAAAKDSIGYVEAGIVAMGWPACVITVDEVEEVDLEKELQEGRL